MINLRTLAKLLIPSTAFVISTTATWANPQAESPKSKIPVDSLNPDLHLQNRAIAFASVQMANRGAAVEDWKAIEHFVEYYCGDMGTPVPEPSGHLPEPEPAPLPPSEDPSYPPIPCTKQSTVYYVTSYHFEECPDGRAYISRSGEGVSLRSKTTGDYFSWAEGHACNSEFPEQISLTDPNRPLVPNHIIKSL